MFCSFVQGIITSGYIPDTGNNTVSSYALSVRTLAVNRSQMNGQNDATCGEFQRDRARLVLWKHGLGPGG